MTSKNNLKWQVAKGLVKNHSQKSKGKWKGFNKKEKGQ